MSNASAVLETLQQRVWDAECEAQVQRNRLEVIKATLRCVLEGWTENNVDKVHTAADERLL